MSQLARLCEILDSIPRRAPAPSERDLQIYAAVQAAGLTQAQAAEQFGVTQSQISRILQRVRRWRRAEDLASGEADRGRIAARLDYERLEQLYRQAIRSYDRSQQPLETVRKRSGRRGEWTERVYREREGDVSLLKSALQTAQQLQTAQRRSEAADAQSLGRQRCVLAVQVLIELRKEAEQLGLVRRGQPAKRLVRKSLAELLGLPLEATDPNDHDLRLTIHTNERRNDLAQEEVTFAAGDATSNPAIVCGEDVRRKSISLATPLQT